MKIELNLKNVNAERNGSFISVTEFSEGQHGLLTFEFVTKESERTLVTLELDDLEFLSLALARKLTGKRIYSIKIDNVYKAVNASTMEIFELVNGNLEFFSISSNGLESSFEIDTNSAFELQTLIYKYIPN